MKNYLWSQKISYHSPSYIIENDTVYTDDMSVYREKFQLLKKEIGSSVVFYNNSGMQIAISKRKFIISGHYKELDDTQKGAVFTYICSNTDTVEEILKDLIKSSQMIDRTINEKIIDEIATVLSEYRKKRYSIKCILLCLIIAVFILISTIIIYKL